MRIRTWACDKLDQMQMNVKLYYSQGKKTENMVVPLELHSASEAMQVIKFNSQALNH